MYSILKAIGITPNVFSESAEDEESNSTAVLITKISFIIICFLEALIAGMIPTWSPGCRENPKIIGIANSFAGGVFMAIAFMHIMPEAIEGWNDMPCNKHMEDGVEVENEKIFPLPELLIFVGYTIILIIDKVLFDTHALFAHDEEGHHHDPADHKYETNVKASMSKSAKATSETSDPAALKRSRIEEKEDIEGAMKSYLNPHDRFATRMKASMKKDGEGPEDDQAALFVDGGYVDPKHKSADGAGNQLLKP